MKTYTNLTTLFTSLSNNTTTTNTALGGQLISDQHRYLIQKYFDNERTYQTVTIGANDYTLTAPPATGASSATLTAGWTDISSHQKVVFSNSDQREVYFTQGSTTVRWTPGLSSAATTALHSIGVQFYPLPANISKIKNDTITVGQLVYTPAPVQSIQEWTLLNALPYTSNIPGYFYIYNNEVGFFPIPSSSNQIVTFNYKARFPDLSFSDFSTGTLSNLTVGSNAVTGVGTTWNSVGLFPLNTDLSFFNLALRISPPSGDGIWYPIERFLSDTSLLLQTPIQNVTGTTAASYTIGQLPLLQEDFHDMPVYGALVTYYSSIKKDEGQFKMFKGMYDERLVLLEAYAANKSVNVDLGAQVIQTNPNLYLFAPHP